MHNQAAVLSVAIFLLVYFFIVSRRLNEAVAALAGSLILVLLGVITQQQAVANIDFSTLGLLVGMMIVVEIARHSGLFQYVGVLAAHTRSEPLGLLLTFTCVIMQKCSHSKTPWMV